jgi:hypothetical protein
MQSQWHPIETAPKNIKDRFLAIEIVDREDALPSYFICAWNGECWINIWDLHGFDWDPTHWMPLPEPPK